MLKKIGLGLGVVIIVLAGVIALQPDTFTLSRSITINAPAEKAFVLVNDFHNWKQWSPWAKLDLAEKETFSGSTQGEGAMFAWDGNSKVGAGKMTITKASPFTSIDITTDFIRPMKATHSVQFSFVPEGNNTRVTWTMSGKKCVLAKACCLVRSMEKMVGPDFEKGLAQLKVAAEK